MDSITADLDNVFVYIDDILVASPTKEQHLVDLNNLFQKLKMHGLIIQKEKCEFGKTTIQFLGHEISRNGIEPIQTRIMELQQYPLPQTQQELRRFLGLVNFYLRFIKKCASLTKPLNEMLPKGKASNAKIC
jgi:hypothetical protein